VNTTGAFVGRDAEQRVIEQVLEAAGGGAAGIVQIIGEPGIGKTRLLGQLHECADRVGLAVLSSRGTEFDRDVPYGVLTDLVEDLVSGPYRDALDGMAAADRNALLAPEIDDGSVERYRRHRAVRQALALASRRRGLVVCLDDAHWADGGSLDCWAHLVRRLPRAPVVLVLAHRPQPLPANLDAALSDAHRAGVGRLLELGPLAFGEAVELMGRTRGPAWRAAVYAASGGNPLYLESLVRVTRHPGPPDADLRIDALPATIRAALRAEVDVLDAAVRTVAWAAAVAGDPFDAEVMAEIAAVPEPDALAALDVLCLRDLLRPAGARRFRYRHALVRQVVYEAAEPGWRLAAHERAVAVLTRRGSGLLVRAYHVERAARFGDRDAVDTLFAAAEQTVSRSPVTAAHWLRAALRLLPEDTATTSRRHELGAALANALALAGELAESRAVLGDLLGSLHGAPAAARTPAVVLTAMVDRLLGFHERARALLAEELAGLGDRDRRAAVTIELELAAAVLMAGAFDLRSRQLVDTVAQQAAELGDRSLIAAAVGMSVMAAFLTGDVVAVEQRADQAASLVDALQDDELTHRLDAVIWLGWGELHYQRWAAALRHLDRGLRLARGSGQVHVLTYLLAARACALRWQGDLTAALDCAEDAVEAATLSGSAELGAMAHGMHCWVAILVGDLELAVRTGAAAVANAGGNVGWWTTIARLLNASARLALDSSLDIVDDVLAAGGGPELSRVDPFSKPLWYAILAGADLVRGRVREAARWAEHVEHFADDFPVQRGIARLTSARIASVDDPARALALAEKAVVAFVECGARIEVAEARAFAGTMLARLGQRAAAVTHLDAAVEEFAACGARRAHAQAVAELRRLGRRVPSFEAGRRRGRSGLTTREQDVARLLAAGRTNRQIADELVISMKTVESHVSHILTKLGVPSRAAAVVVLGDQA
jgi:DNA-binding CsgD family transcriptional regulator